MRRSASLPCSCAAIVLAAIASPFVCASIAEAAAQAPAQAGASPVTAPAPDYSAESGVIEHFDTTYTYAADGTCVYEHSIAVRVQSEAAVRALGVINVPYAGNTQKVEFEYARVRHADGSVVESAPADAIEMPAPVTREAPFYSDLKEKQLPIRGLRSGDTLEWKARVTANKPEAPGQFWGSESFLEDGVILSQTLELRIPEGVQVNVWAPKYKPAESTVAAAGSTPALHVYRWTTSQLKPTVGKTAQAEEDAKKKTVWTPEQELDEDQGKLPSVAWSTFKSWQEVGAWYRALEADRTVATPEIKAKVAELIAGKTTDEDKVRAIYAYVSAQVRYIGVAFGIGRYQPHTAAEIFANQYGDCKDKHTLLASMLAAAGIQSDAALIGAGVRFNPDLPSPAAFNHVITHLTLPGAAGGAAQTVWLDSTEEVAPYRMMVSVLRDRQALVVLQSGEAQIVRTPADPPFATFQTMEATGSLDATGTSHSRIVFSLRGDTELILRAGFHQASPAQYDEVVQQVSRGIGYQGTTSNADVSRPEDTAAPFRMSYDYEREKSGDWPNLRIVPQVAPVSIPRPADDDPLVHSIDLGTPRVETSKAAMKLPDGWTAVLPEAAHFKCAYATYDQTYRFEKGTVYTERRLEVLKPKVPTADLKAYKKFAIDADLGSEFFIQLVRHQTPATSGDSNKKADATPAEVHPATAPNPASIDDPAKLIEEAYNDVEKNDLSSAQPLLDRAKALSPDHEYYWNTLGYLNLRNGQTDNALTDYKKELELHPNAVRRMSPVIIRLDMAMDRRKDAMDVLRQWVADDPENPAPVEQLVNMLVADGDAKQAVAVGEAALPHLAAGTQTEIVQTELGAAYIKAGDKQKAVATLEAVLKNTDDAGPLNDAAYALADAGLDLPMAESSTRVALDKLGAESNAWTLDEDPNTLLTQSRLIGASWDTLGWVLYREGKLDEAESYIKAAWHDRPEAEVGEHLATIQAARGDKSAALETYQLAIANFPSYNAMGVRVPPTERQKQFQRKADDLRKAGAKAAGGDARQAMQRQQTVSLGAAGGRNGVAEYRILLRSGKYVKAKPMEDKTVAGAEEMMQKADFSRFFPNGANASLVRTAFVNCHQNVCELLLQ